MEEEKCSKCGGKMYTLTEYYAAKCPVHHLINNETIFCIDCGTNILKKNPEEVRYWLKNPILECEGEDCPRGSSTCAASPAARSAMIRNKKEVTGFKITNPWTSYQYPRPCSKP